MAEHVRTLLEEIVELRRRQYERIMAAGEGESVEAREMIRLRYLEACLELARYDAEPRERSNG